VTHRLSLSFILGMALAGSALAAPKDCIWDRNDPFDTGARMPGPSITRMTGKCLDTRIERSIVILNLKADFPNEEPSEGYRVANFRYKDKFWIAQFPPLKDAIDEVIFEKQRFPLPIPRGENMGAHAMIRFKLKPGKEIELVTQSKQGPVERAAVRDFMYSVEAIGVEGFDFDVFQAMQGKFALAYRFVATEEKFRHVVIKAKQKTEQFRLNLKGDDKATIVESALTLSHESGLKKMYRFTYRNCSTEAFQTLDRVLNYQKYSGKRAGNTMNPIDADKLLKKRGLIDAASTIPDLNQEEMPKDLASQDE
jgi:hypothetical protein